MYFYGSVASLDLQVIPQLDGMGADGQRREEEENAAAFQDTSVDDASGRHEEAAYHQADGHGQTECEDDFADLATFFDAFHGFSQ